MPRSSIWKEKSFDLTNSGLNNTAVVAQLVRAPACRRAAFPSKGGLKLSGISVKAKSYYDMRTPREPYTSKHIV